MENNGETSPGSRIWSFRYLLIIYVVLLLDVRRRALAGFATIVLFADKLENLPRGMQLHLETLTPGSREDLRIVHCDVIGHNRRACVMEALDQVQLVAVPA